MRHQIRQLATDATRRVGGSRTVTKLLPQDSQARARIKRMRRRLLGVDRSLFAQATPEDLYSCYRLFLQREPTETEAEFWMPLLEAGQLLLETLVDEFITGAEFTQVRAEHHRIEEIELEHFTSAVRPHDVAVGLGIHLHRTHEPQVTACISSRLRTGDVFLDVGANIGYFSLLAASLVGETGRVIAVEPNHNNCGLLERSLALNRFANVEIHRLAAAEKAFDLYLDTQGSSSNGRVIDDSVHAVPGRTVPVSVRAVRLDDHLDGLERLELVKIDIEGAEPRAVEGMEQLLLRLRPAIVTEFSPDLIEVTSHQNPIDYLEQLVALDYELRIIGDEPGNSLRPQDVIERVHGLTHVDLVLDPLSA